MSRSDFAQENQAYCECRYDRTYLGSWRIPTNKERVGIGQVNLIFLNT
jgi:hypothetical protein